MRAVIAVSDARSREDICVVLGMCFADFCPVLVDDGAHLIESLHNNPDIVIMDYHPPGGDGWELLGQARLMSAVPILILTWVQDESDILGAIEAGADAYCTKPVNQLELVARIRALLRRSGAHPE